MSPGTGRAMSDAAPAGDLVASFLERCGVEQAFGVISTHNMPILDAISRRNRIRFVSARSEQGAVNMADANARVRGGLGVAVTSTGPGAANACGALVEAAAAGTPLLHLTGQIDLPYLDRNRGDMHEARDQLGMLRSVGKAAFRVWSTDTLLGTLRQAVRTALTPPAGPVSVEIPIDVQGAKMPMPAGLDPLPVEAPAADAATLDSLADALAGCKRVVLWLGGGARHAGDAVARLAGLGFGIVTSIQGRGVMPGEDGMSLGAFNLQPATETFYGTCDAMVVVGSRLRSNETYRYTLTLPSPLYQIDADPAAEGRSYPTDMFVCGDAAEALSGLADRLEGLFTPDETFAGDIERARGAAEKELRATLGPYNDVLDAVIAAAPKDFVWVRDVTLSNSTWGNRLPPLDGPRNGVHALGGGIGQAMPMGIGAALAVGAEGRKTLVLAGDGGFAVTLGELATARQENADIAILLMNDGGYGVIRNIQDAKFDGRRVYADLLSPDFGRLCAALDIPHWGVGNGTDLAAALESAIAADGPAVVEIDMQAIGDFARPFAGPPARK